VADTHTYELLPVHVPEFRFTNLYGTDVTAARAIAQANRENERLLLNILPSPIAERLRRGERVIADRFDDATLLIADIVGFTAMSSDLAAIEVVNLLNRIFSACDELVDRHGLEKVKTIGDAYMVVGGVPTYVEDHLERVADLALDLAAAVEAMQENVPRRVALRIGIHSGPLVAGVIGAKKFIYDVWGDTVNQASRMEALSLPGRIHVTQAVRDRLQGRYEFEPRGIIDVKGKGAMPTWFLVGAL
jgi:adenylate cyclase